MTVNCDICVNKRYYPPKAIEDVCRFCKEKNGKFYRPDLTDVRGYVTVLEVKKNDTQD